MLTLLASAIEVRLNELGHNFGSGHECAEVNPARRFPFDGMTCTSYSCGHGNAVNGWGTIISRLNTEVIDFKFSHLHGACLGEACGIIQGQAS